MFAAAVPDLSASSGSSGPPIRMVRVSKSFLGTHAVREVDLDVNGGEVHAIVGENGAGKSTLMRVLAGSYSDYSGDIYVNGAPERIETPRRARELGFALVHQELSLVPELSVAENMFLGREARSKIPGFIDRRATERRAAAILQEVEAGISPRDRVGSLSLAKQQLVEIAKGISTEPRVLILDEPTSSLTQPEIDDLFRVVRSARERGVAILYISHKLPEIFALADRITVMRDGRKLGSRPVREWTEPELVREMVGRSLAEFFPRQHESIEPTPILEVRSLSQDPYFADVSFSIRRGEIVGIVWPDRLRANATGQGPVRPRTGGLGRDPRQWRGPQNHGACPWRSGGNSVRPGRSARSGPRARSRRRDQPDAGAAQAALHRLVRQTPSRTGARPVQRSRPQHQGCLRRRRQSPLSAAETSRRSCSASGSTPSLRC